MKKRAVITGLGPITALGIGKNAFWQGLQTEKSAIGHLQRFCTDTFSAKCAAEINNFDPGVFFPPHRLKRLDRYAQFSVASAILALEDSGLDLKAEHLITRAGVSYGSALGGIANAEEEHVKYLKGGSKAVKQTLALQVFGGSAHSNIAIEFGFQGIGTTNSNSCASGAVALGDALHFIQAGLADVVVAGAAEAPLSPLTFLGFDLIKTMSRSAPPEACCPFDKRRDGFVMSEGAGSLVVEEYEHAKKRGARIYAELLGYSLNNDGFHMTSPHPSGNPTVRAMQDALAMAGKNPGDVEYINAHASSTQMNDANESSCIHRVFGEHAKKVPVSGTKAYTGHPLGASGAVEAIICMLAMEKDYLPPTLHYREPDPACALDVIPHTGRQKRVNCILSNSFGFGGINSCVVFGRV